MNKKELTLKQIAQLGLWLDDPYGDGIRLDKIRNPSVSRKEAIEFVSSGQLSFDGESLIREAYEEYAYSSLDENGELFAYIAVNFSFK